MRRRRSAVPRERVCCPDVQGEHRLSQTGARREGEVLAVLCFDDGPGRAAPQLPPIACDRDLLRAALGWIRRKVGVVVAEREADPIGFEFCVTLIPVEVLLAKEGFDLEVAASALQGVPASAPGCAIVEKPLIDDIRVDDRVATLADWKQVLEGQLDVVVITLRPNEVVLVGIVAASALVGKVGVSVDVALELVEVAEG